MINVSAIQMQQFGVRFYQASLSAKDIDKLVRFEVLSYGEQHHPPVRGKKSGGAVSKVNWNLLERRIAANDKAYQRQIIRRKIDELVGYYEQCRQARDLPSIPGAVIISCDDLGSCHAANVGVFEALHDGVATCASIMVPAPWAGRSRALAMPRVVKLWSRSEAVFSGESMPSRRTLPWGATSRVSAS